MRDEVTYLRSKTVYPGEYIPMPEVEALLEEFNTSGKPVAARPLLNMNEFKDCFKIEVVLPGVNREDIFINIHHYILSIAVLHKDCNNINKIKFQIHEFDSDCYLRHILLPENADTEFISAVYNQGILHLHIPKTNEPFKATNKNIVVY